MSTQKNDPCWAGYEQVGTKEKNGKTVPNCTPTKKKGKKSMSLKELKESLSESIYDGQMEMSTSQICVSDLEYLEKFTKKMSAAFQSSLPNVLEKIETELNKFGCTLGELDSELPFEDTGSEDFAIFKFAAQEMVTNAYLTLDWETISGQQNPHRPDGSKLRYDIHLELVRNNPMDNIEETGDELTTDDLVKEGMEDKADLTAKRVSISKKIETLKQDLIDSGVLPKNGGIRPDAPKEVMENPKVKEILRLRAEHDKLGEDLKNLTEETGLKTYEVIMKDGTKRMIKGYSASHLKTYDDVKSAKLVKEATDPSFRSSLKNLSNSQLKAKLKYFRDKDQDKYNALVSEFESRGLKENVLTEISKNTLNSYKQKAMKNNLSFGTKIVKTGHDNIDKKFDKYSDNKPAYNKKATPDEKLKQIGALSGKESKFEVRHRFIKKAIDKTEPDSKRAGQKKNLLDKANDDLNSAHKARLQAGMKKDGGDNDASEKYTNSALKKYDSAKDKHKKISENIITEFESRGLKEEVETYEKNGVTYNQPFKESVEQLDESTVVVKQKPTSVIFEMGPDKVEFSLKGQEAQFKLISESGSSVVTMNPKQTQKFFEGLTEFYISKTSK